MPHAHKVHKSGVGNKTGPHSLILILIGATTVVCLLAARERPSIKIESEGTQTHLVGAQASLYCTATGIPEPHVEWVRVDGQPLSPRHRVEGRGYVV